jgi:hypothetical protein
MSLEKIISNEQLEGEVISESSFLSTIDSGEKKRIGGLVNDFHKTRAVLAYAEHLRSLPDFGKKVSEYKAKLAELSKNPPTDPDEGLPKGLQEAKEAYGDDWNRVYSQLRSVALGTVMTEILDSEFEPVVRFMVMYPGNMVLVPVEYRNRFAVSSGINPYTEPDKFWQAYKDNLRKVFSQSTGRLDQLKTEFDIPNEVVEIVRDELRNGWHMMGCQFFVDSLSDKSIKQSQKHLAEVERKLDKYPGWEKFEREIFQPAKSPTNPQKTATLSM